MVLNKTDTEKDLSLLYQEFKQIRHIDQRVKNWFTNDDGIGLLSFYQYQ
ncbi:hypothetical protein PM8797T_20294 [Gimesia maris DSM 8797]|nr:hypothetical protein PM8797T_20294 [Gimesia maris DSM 8797]